MGHVTVTVSAPACSGAELGVWFEPRPIVQGLSPDSPLLGSVGIGWMLLAINDVDVARMDREAVLCALTRCGGAVRRLVLNPEPRRRLPWHARLSPGRSPRFELAARAERLATQLPSVPPSFHGFARALWASPTSEARQSGLPLRRCGDLAELKAVFEARTQTECREVWRVPACQGGGTGVDIGLD